MSRYFRATKPRADWLDNDSPLIPSLTVSDHAPIKTGLIWHDGEPIMRTPNPMGFGRDEEW